MLVNISDTIKTARDCGYREALNDFFDEIVLNSKVRNVLDLQENNAIIELSVIQNIYTRLLEKMKIWYCILYWMEIHSIKICKGIKVMRDYPRRRLTESASRGLIK